MKQITNKEYEEWQKYKEEKAKGHILMPDTLRFICAANDYDPTKIGQHFPEVLAKVCLPEKGAQASPVNSLLMECQFFCKPQKGIRCRLRMNSTKNSVR